MKLCALEKRKRKPIVVRVADIGEVLKREVKDERISLRRSILGAGSCEL